MHTEENTKSHLDFFGFVEFSREFVSLVAFQPPEVVHYPDAGAVLLEEPQVLVGHLVGFRFEHLPVAFELGPELRNDVVHAFVLGRVPLLHILGSLGLVHCGRCGRSSARSSSTWISPRRGSRRSTE